MRAYAGPVVLRIAAGRSGMFNEHRVEQSRERKGLRPGIKMLKDTVLTGTAQGAHARILTTDELWSVYHLCPDVRSAIDSIVRLVSTWDNGVAPVKGLDADDPMYDRALDAAEEAQRFLKAPNQDETQQTFFSKGIRDLMIYDSWASENALSSGGELEELVMLPGDTTEQVVDGHSRTVGYVQTTDGIETHLAPEQVMYFNLFPNSTTPGGTPLIESLINEFIILMQSAKHLTLAYDVDEVAPGLLVLAGIAGAAGQRTVDSLRNMKGADHKLRIVTSNNPKGLDAKWVEFRHTPKDLDMKDLVHEVRRIVWRLFGVKPVNMGDSEATPRATAEVQVDAEESGLIRPILELVEAQINTRILPLLVGDPELAGYVELRFDMERALVPAERKDEAEADASDFDRAGMTINELRIKRGRTTLENGDVALVKHQGGYITLDTLLARESAPVATEGPVAEPAVDDGGEDDSGTDDDAADASNPEEGEEGSGEVEAGRPVSMPQRRLHMAGPAPVRRRGRVPRCSCGQHSSEPATRLQRRASSLLPSEWQPGSKFEDYRTLNLTRLGDSLIDYRRAVTPLYLRAKLDTISAFRSYLGDNVLDSTEGAQLATRVSDILDRLTSAWDGATAEDYRGAARVGRDAAVHFTGAQVVQDWQERAEAYQQRAMGYLTAPGGLVSDLKAQLMTVITANVRGTPERKLIKRFVDAADPDAIDALLVLSAVTKAFDRNEHRIDNWSGRLVQLSNQVLNLGMSESAPPSGDGGDGGETLPEEEGQGEWYVQWVSVGDNRMCATCEREGNAGFQPLSALSTEPGGNTECRARCRCVTVWWTKAEVDNKTAVDLSG